MRNVYILHSPWEADVAAITAAGYWHEYEVKLTVADYRNDFQKKVSRFAKYAPRKHEMYKGGEEVRRYGRVIPRPKTFSFVVPQGLLDGVDVPEYCGITEYGQDLPYNKTKLCRVAPTLANPTKLDFDQMFNLACKASLQRV